MSGGRSRPESGSTEANPSGSGEKAFDNPDTSDAGVALSNPALIEVDVQLSVFDPATDTYKFIDDVHASLTDGNPSAIIFRSAKNSESLLTATIISGMRFVKTEKRRTTSILFTAGNDPDAQQHYLLQGIPSQVHAIYDPVNRRLDELDPTRLAVFSAKKKAFKCDSCDWSTNLSRELIRHAVAGHCVATSKVEFTRAEQHAKSNGNGGHGRSATDLDDLQEETDQSTGIPTKKFCGHRVQI